MFKQPFSSVNRQMGDWLHALAHSLATSRGIRRDVEATRVLKRGNDFRVSLKTTDFNSAKCSGGGTGDACLPASRCEHRCFPELPPPLYPPTPLSHHTHLFSFLNITGANQQTSDCTSFLKLSRITTISSWIIIVNNPSH